MKYEANTLVYISRRQHKGATEPTGEGSKDDNRAVHLDKQR